MSDLSKDDKQVTNISGKETAPLLTTTSSSTKAPAGFFTRRLNKDNLFNLAFFVLTSIALVSAEFLTKTFLPSFAVPATFATLLVAVLIALRINPVEFKNDGYKIDKSIIKSKLGKRGIRETKVLPGMQMILFPLVIFKIVFTGPGFLDFEVPAVVSMSINVTCVLFITSTYCILKNLPITIYSRKEAWRQSSNRYDLDRYQFSDHKSSTSYSSSYSSGNSMSNSSNTYYNPSYKSYFGNIFNK